MSKKVLPPEKRKIKFSITIDPELYYILSESQYNKSKYVEKLILNDLKDKKKLNND